MELSSGRLGDIEAGEFGVKGLGHIHCLPLNIDQLLLLEGYVSLVHARTVLLRLLEGAGALEAIGEGFGIGSDPERVRLVEPLQESEEVTVAHL